MLSVMKNAYVKHDWAVTGGHDPEQDGDNPQWGRLAIECRTCGEQGRVWRGVSLDYDPVAYGCRRLGDDRWRSDDLLIRDGFYLDLFVRWLPEGMVQTYNRGGHYHEVEPSQLYPA